MADSEVKNFSAPDGVREMPLGRGEVLAIGGGEVLRMTLQPGWRWSTHVAPMAGTQWCAAPHFQYVISGHLAGQMADGTEFAAGPGDVSVLAPGHDAWVVGDEPVVAVDWGGAHLWARPPEE